MATDKRVAGAVRQAHDARVLSLSKGAGAVVFFSAAVLLLSGTGLLLTRRQVEGWGLVFGDDAEVEPPGACVKVPFSLLAEWQDARKEAPPPLAELDGERVELCGFVRELKGASGFWLVTDPLAVNEAWRPAVEKSVWVEFPPGTSPSRPVGRGEFVRARGVLRVGLAEVSGVGTVAFRLETRELWLRRSRRRPQASGKHPVNPDDGQVSP